MRPVTKKILESGIVDRHVAAMLTRWGTIEPTEYDHNRRKFETKAQLEQFAEELEALIEKEEDLMRETPLDMPVGVLEEFVLPSRGTCFSARWDSMGRLVLEDWSVKFKRGDQINGRDKFYRVLDSTVLYQGEGARARLVTVEEW
jgi:hypothetical protein